MLQYPVQLPPLSLASSPNSPPKDPFPFRPNDSTRLPLSSLNSKRFQKDPYGHRPAFTGRHPSPITPLSISTNLSPSPSPSSPSTTSGKFPLRPYISARQTSIPVPFANPSYGPTKSSAHSRSASISSALIEDVLEPGDSVGEGLILQGQVLRLVSIGLAFDEYQEPTREFEVVRRLGTGSYAVVYLVQEVLSRPPPSEDGHMSTIGSMELDGKFVRHPQTIYGREFALKLLSKANLDEEALAAQMSEVTIHQSLHLHPNIVTLHCTLETSSFLLLLLEYVPGEDLFYFLEQSRDHYDLDISNTTDSSVSASHTPPTPSLLSNLNPSQLLSRSRLRLIGSMFAQMCDAVAACHDQQVFHRDIKPENFIVTDGWTMLPSGRQERKVVVKLTDFGLSTSDIESSDMDCGSAPYMSYECRNNVAPTYGPRAADVWSLGIVLINMLYHCNPWTDTAQGACHSFDMYRQDPINFFLNRFAGMTRPVAEFLSNNVFCILEDDINDSRRISATGFGNWAKNLPTLLGSHPMQRTMSSSSTQGHRLSSSIPLSHRPISRHPSVSTTAGRTPAMPTRSLSRAPSLGPAYEREEASELSTVMDQENEEDIEDVDAVEPDQDGTASRSTSTTKRRKRGARKGKGNPVASPTTPKDETLMTLAVASQSLAREISKASKQSSNRSGSTKTSISSSRRRQPFEPVSMYAIPTPLLNPRSTARPTPIAPPPSILSPPTPPPPSVPASVLKKPSRWKLSFGKASAAALASNAGRVSPVEEVSQPASIDFQHPVPVSATVSNVTSLIMGLNAPTAHSTPISNKSDDSSSAWSRGRRDRESSPPVKNASRSPVYSLPSKSQTALDSWSGSMGDKRSDRQISPHSSRGGRPIGSSASSMVSGNWRSSMSTSSSAGTSTSAFTRYSNSSARSVSTTATSVSAASWRTSLKQPSISSNSSHSATGGYTTLPKNIKIMNGVPWELDELPRGQHPNPTGDIFGSPPMRKQRTRKPKDLKLDTINERPPNSAGPKSPQQIRKDAMTSTTDLAASPIAKDEGEGGVKKVHKGQINALAKMLSALRR